jgi:beta-mannosidase
MQTLDLSARSWQLQGWRPFYWQARRSMETGGIFSPEFGPFPARVPGSVQDALRRAGLLPDWNVGRNSLECEWVEHRHWEFFTEFRAGELPAGQPLVLQAEGLDYSGWILVDCKIVAAFRGALIRHRFDLGGILNDGQAHRLSVVFDIPPEEQGQIGRTSLSRHFKPRFSFSWDWCVRFVPIGIWDSLFLECGSRPLELIAATTTTSRDLASGAVTVRIRNQNAKKSRAALTLRSPAGRVVLRKTLVLEEGENRISLPVKKPDLWWPNGLGKAALYSLEIRGSAPRTAIFREKIGFKHVRWLPCAGSPQGARPLLCEVNGKALFLQGVNWTPIQMDYPSTPGSSYRRLIRLYRGMGCNVLRVWGGAYLEKEIFYRLCDEAGLLVWQEFPLCSSGIDSDAPRNRGVIRELCEIATDYVRRRQHHASLLLWCGGNELQSVSRPGKPSKPLGESHPALAALRRVVEVEQPGIRFLPASPSGPVFFARRDNMGKGIHHHVHGPWDGGGRTGELWEDYWSHDDSLLRAETGVGGAASVSLIRRYAGNEDPWPPSFENPWWRHSSAWWLQWSVFREQVVRVPAGKRLAAFVKLSQKKQADFLALAARSCKERFPGCAGFLIWMGHDAFPCPANTSIIDFEGRPKPAYKTLQKVFRNSRASTGHRSHAQVKVQ